MALIEIIETGGLGPIELEVSDEEPGITPASRICLEGIGSNRELLRGTGIDWGTGSGCLAIAAARIPAVDYVIGIDVVREDVALAASNAERNGVGEKVRTVEADLFEPVRPEDAEKLTAAAGRCGFLIANPPASRDDDGLGWRRRVLDEARRYLLPGAPALVQVSYQYGERIARLGADVPGYTHEAVVATTDWVPFDQQRADLLELLAQYAREERRGGSPYAFQDPRRVGSHVSAVEALAAYRQTGESPRSKWQMHLFRWEG